MKIAVPVESNKMDIALRMGHAAYFAVFDTHPERMEAPEYFVNEHDHKSHSGHHGEHQGRGHGHGQHGHGSHAEPDEEAIAEHQRDLGVLRECDAVIVRGIGPNMKAALKREGIQIFRASKALGSTADALMTSFSQDPGAFKEE